MSNATPLMLNLAGGLALWRLARDQLATAKVIDPSVITPLIDLHGAR